LRCQFLPRHFLLANPPAPASRSASPLYPPLRNALALPVSTPGCFSLPFGQPSLSLRGCTNASSHPYSAFGRDGTTCAKLHLGRISGGLACAAGHPAISSPMSSGVPNR